MADPKDQDDDWKVIDRQFDDDGDYTVTWVVTQK